MVEKKGKTGSGKMKFSGPKTFGDGGKVSGVIKWFSEINNEDVKIAGGKGASLGEMYNRKFPIPPGFVVTAQAYKYFLESSGIDKKIYSLLEELDINDTEKLNQVSKEIRELIESSTLPEEIQEEVLEAYEILDVDKKDMEKAGRGALEILRTGHEPPFVAIRSSATAEDLVDASFAGQQESFLNVKGGREVLKKVRQCFSSLFTPRAIYYREKKGFKHNETYLAVIVQKMIDADKSGVIFSKNPVKNDENILMEAVFGLGEGIVSGRIKPDVYVVDKEVDNLKIIRESVSDKKIAVVRDSSGKTGIVKLSGEKSNQRVLVNYEIKRLAQFASMLEKHYGLPQDIEFAISGSEIYIVQSRPITTKVSVNQDKEVSGSVLLSGLAASPGVASGVVRVVHNLNELNKVKPGDVLVTEMTNPDMVVTMQRAVAIVTNEGGLTCFSGDTKVLTSNGFMEIKDASEKVNLGDEVKLLAYDSLSSKPVWKKIVSAGSRKRNVMRISVSQKGLIEDNILDLTPDHKMIIFKDRKFIKKEISSVLSENRYVCVLDSLPSFVKNNNEKLAYLVGALLSDGYFKVGLHHTGNPRRGSVVFTQKNTPEKEEFIQTVRDYFEECFGEKFAKPREKHTFGSFRGRQIIGSAQDHICSKLHPAITISKISQFLDSWVLRFDDFSSLNFLAGLIDGDGCFHNNRLHIYISKENILQGVILACLNLGIFPQITKNRNIYHIQILERMSDILDYTKRVKGVIFNKILGNKLFSAEQILSDVVNEVNFKGRIRPYVKNNLLIDSRKIKKNLLPFASEKIRVELMGVLNSGLRNQRTKKISDIGEIEVYNLEVDADNEMDHNFVVFTSKYTPILVSNSHAAIISREMGIPAVVGTGDATVNLKEGSVVTVDGNSGKVFEGREETQAVEINPIIQTRTKIKLIVDLPDYAERAAKSGVDSVGLVRLEGIIASSGKHPLKFVKEKNMEEYVEILSRGLKKISRPFKEVWVRSSDIRSDEYGNLEGSPKEREGNPMLGDHGIRFGLRHPEVLKSEFQAIKEVADEFPDKKIGLMIPLVINVSELQEAKRIAREEVDVPENVKIGIMVETPASVQLINQFCEEGVDFVSFGTNDLTQFTLAIDRNNADVQYLFDEMNPAVLSSIRYVIRRCKNYDVETSICGQAGSNNEMVKFLVSEGIDSISVNADAASKISKLIYELEKEELKNIGIGEEVISDEDAVELIEEEKQEYNAEERQIAQLSKPIQNLQSSEMMEQDIEDIFLRELEREDGENPIDGGSSDSENEYMPGLLDKLRHSEIPKLNDAIPIRSEDLEEKKEEEVIDLEEELLDDEDEDDLEEMGEPDSADKPLEDVKLDIF